MNGIENLIGKINEKAEASCEERLAGVRHQADEIRREYRTRGEAAAQQILDKANAQAALDVQRAGGNDTLERSKRILAAKHAMLNAAFERARSKLTNQDQAGRLNFDVKILPKADAAGDEEVILNRRDHDEMGEAVVEAFNRCLASAGLPAKMTLSDECREIDGGFVLKRDRIETDCSISSVLAQMRNELTDDVVKVLFA